MTWYLGIYNQDYLVSLVHDGLKIHQDLPFSYSPDKIKNDNPT